MQPAKITERPVLDLIATVIARSQIVVTQHAGRRACLPAEYDDIDAAVLTWIAAEGRRIGRSFARI